MGVSVDVCAGHNRGNNMAMAIAGATQWNSRRGKAYIYHQTGGTKWNLEIILSQPDAGDMDEFGNAVGISEFPSGRGIAIVGVHYYDNTPSCSGSGCNNVGALYVYRETSTESLAWSAGERLYASDGGGGPNWGDYFSHSLNIVGKKIVVGGVQFPGGPNCVDCSGWGSAWVYEHISGTTFGNEVKIQPQDPMEAEARFGYAVDLNHDGTQLIASARRANTGGVNDAGAAFIFYEISAGVWGNEVKLISEHNSDMLYDEFGWSVAMHDACAVVGSRYDDIGGSNRGSITVFYETSSGVWGDAAVVYPRGTAGANGMVFGYSVTMGEGNMIAVGAPSYSGLDIYAGVAYLFYPTDTRGVFGNVTFQGSDIARKAYYGYSIALDAEYIIIGSPMDVTIENGRAYLHQSDNVTCGECLHEGWCNFNDVCYCDRSLGWEGDNCEIDIDDCASSPCLNGATCVDAGPNAFNCLCDGSYIGTLCEIDVDDCLSSPCTAGVCCDIGPTFSCDCSGTGWQGPTCAVDVEECDSSPCLNDGVCSDGDGTSVFACDCTAVDFRGDTCQDWNDDCIAHDCANAQPCVDGINSFTCDCGSSGWTGAKCLTDIDDCASSPCTNAGGCSDIGPNAFDCECGVSGFTGHTCHTDVDDCASSPCENGGICTDEGANVFSCNCGSSGFTGTLCRTDIDDCVSSPCANAGSCTDAKANVYTCDCASGFTGATCNTDIDDCSSSPCSHGQCTDSGINAYTCDCGTTGFTGITCSSDIDDCVSSPCLNAGLCVDVGANAYFCDCSNTDFTDPLCSIMIDNCVSHECMNGATCVDDVQSYTCVCAPGFEGLKCETDINECLSCPCMNGGSCFDAVYAWYCECTDGFTGSGCQRDIDDCLSSPCGVHSTNCTDDVNAYTCTCEDGYTGRSCTDAILGACSSAPCTAGVCFDVDDTYFCDTISAGKETNVNIIISWNDDTWCMDDAGNALPVTVTMLEVNVLDSGESFETYVENVPVHMTPRFPGSNTEDFVVEVISDTPPYVVDVNFCNRDSLSDNEVANILVDESNNHVDARIIVQQEDDDSDSTADDSADAVLVVVIVLCAVLVVTAIGYGVSKQFRKQKVVTAAPFTVPT